MNIWMNEKNNKIHIYIYNTHNNVDTSILNFFYFSILLLELMCVYSTFPSAFLVANSHHFVALIRPDGTYQCGSVFKISPSNAGGVGSVPS